MTSNEKLTLRALVDLGFNISTGRSDVITIPVLEKHSGIRQTSNGSRIIRRDSRVFGLFNISWNYCLIKGDLKSVQFLGYKTAYDVEKSLKEEKDRLENKISSLEEQLFSTEKALSWVEDNGLEDLTIYDLLEKL